MPVIGHNPTTPSGSITWNAASTTQARLLKTGAYTAITGDTATTFWLYVSGGSGADSPVNYAICSTTDESVPNGTVSVHSGSFTVTAAMKAAPGWYSTSISFGLTASTKYLVQIAGTSAGVVQIGSDSVSASSTSSAGRTTIESPWTATTSWNSGARVAAYFDVVPSAPTITSTSDDTPTSGTTLTINGSNFGTQTGSAGVTVGGVSVTPSNWAASQIPIPITIGANKYGANTAIVVTDSGGVSSSAYNVQIQPASGVNYVNIAAPLAAAEDRITSTPDIADGYQVEWSNVEGGSISDVTVDADGSFVAASNVISFDVRVNDGTVWGAYATQVLAAGRGIVRPLVRSLTNNLVTNLVG